MDRPIFRGYGVAEPSRVVEVDLACRGCRYNLRLAEVDGRCPECGMAVGLSMVGDFLRYADPAWVDKLRWGTLCMLWAAAVTAFVAVLAALAELSSRTGLAAFELLTTASRLVGGWLLTTPDPSGLGEHWRGALRWIIRGVLVLGVVVQGSLLVHPDFSSSPVCTRRLDRDHGVAEALVVIGTVGTLRYLRRLGKRLPDNNLIAQAGTLASVMGVPTVLILVPLAAVGEAGRLAGSCGPTVAAFCALPTLLLIRFANAFAQQAVFARQTWASATSDVSRRKGSEP